jgi:Tfp pilus assembly protein PilO
MYIKNNILILFILLATITQVMYFLFLFSNRKDINNKTDQILQKEKDLENLIQSLYLYTDSINSKLSQIESQKAEIVTINNTYVQKSEHIYHLNPEDSYLLFTSWLSKIDTIRGR